MPWILERGTIALGKPLNFPRWRISTAAYRQPPARKIFTTFAAEIGGM